MWYVLTCIIPSLLNQANWYVLEVKCFSTLVNFFWSFDSVIDYDISISRDIFHGHIFTCCLTTGRGSGVCVEWRKNCWLTGRYNAMWDSWSALHVIVETVWWLHLQLVQQGADHQVHGSCLTHTINLHALSPSHTHRMQQCQDNHSSYWQHHNSWLQLLCINVCERTNQKCILCIYRSMDNLYTMT